MSRLLLTLAVAATFVAAPFASRADDWEHGGGYDEDGYDVSVDLNVQGGGVGVETFHAPLQPYGDWVVVGSYGQVWRPRVAAGWRPYYYGRWEWTNEGWLWVSDEPWGWAAYHYGRWAYDPGYGWLWVPGSEWAPAWVSWRVSGDVVGWAPLAPGFSAYVTTYPFVDAWWTFVPSGRFCSMPAYSAAYAPGYARHWYQATTPAPAFVSRGGPGRHATPAWGGPPPRLIEQHVGRPLTPVRIVGAPSPAARGGRPGEIAIYRPERGWGRGDRGAPAPAFGGRGAPAAAPGFTGRGAPAPAPGFAGRDERSGGFRDGRAPEYRPPARAPEYRAPERAPEYRPPVGPRAPEFRGGERAPAPPAAPHGGPPAGFRSGGHEGSGRGGWAPPPAGNRGGGAPAPAMSQGGGAPPAVASGGGHRPAQGGGAHGRGERH